MQLQSSDDAVARTVALERSPEDVVRSAVEISRVILDADSTFAAVATGQGSFPMTIMSGIRDHRFGQINVKPGAGLGGQVLLRDQPLTVADYAHDPTISRDFVHVVSEIEGLSGMACVPIVGPAGVAALLYAGSRLREAPGDVTVNVLEHVCGYAALALHQLAVRRRETELELLRERQRLAVELHDSVAQMLFAIGVAAHYSRAHRDPETLLSALEEIEGTAADARRELRDTIERLGRHGEGIAFEARLEGEVRLFERTSHTRVTLTRGGEARALPQPVEDLLLDALIEGLRNIAKHTAATLAVAHLGYGEDHVTLALQSPQTVFPCEKSRWRGQDAGAGMAMLEQRAVGLGGRLVLESEPGERRLLRLELPTVPTGRGR